jgi:O-antigen/teichoic acid export membrane protein
MATCIITAVVSLAALIWLNIPAARNFVSIRPSFDLKPLGLLFAACLPLFLGSFLQSDLINVPRYGIAGTLNNTDQTIYAIIYMPALVINLLVGFVFKPLLTSLAEMLELRKLDEFLHLLLKCVGIIAGVSVLGEIAAYFIGIPILSLLYGVNLDAYLPALLTIILGGALNALSVILYYSLVTMRSQILVVICYLGADLLAHGISGWLIASYQLMGAVFTYDLSMALLCVLFLIAFFYSFKRQK